MVMDMNMNECEQKYIDLGVLQDLGLAWVEEGWMKEGWM